MGRAARRSRSVGPPRSPSTRHRPPSPSSRRTRPRILRRRSRPARSAPSTQPRVRCGRCSTAMCSHSSGRPTGKPSRRSTFARRTVARAPARHVRRALGWPRRPPARAAPAVPPFAAEAPGIGLHLSFIDAASGAIRSERDIRVSELFAFQVVPYFDQYALSHRFWAAGQQLDRAAARPTEDELDHVVVIPADGGDPRAVATGWIGFWSP